MVVGLNLGASKGFTWEISIKYVYIFALYDMALMHVRDVFLDCFLHACERSILSLINKNAKVYQNLWAMVVVLFSYSLTFFSSDSILLNHIILSFFLVIIMGFLQVRRLRIGCCLLFVSTFSSHDAQM